MASSIALATSRFLAQPSKAKILGMLQQIHRLLEECDRLQETRWYYRLLIVAAIVCPTGTESLADDYPITIRAHAANVNSVFISEKANCIVSGGDDNQVCAWDVRTGQKLRAFPGHKSPVTAVRVSKDGGLVLSCGEHTIRGCDFKTGKELFGLTERGTLLTIQLSPDGKFLASTTIESIALWDLNKKEKIASLELPESAQPPLGLAFSPDGKHVAAACFDKTLRLLAVPKLVESTKLQFDILGLEISFANSDERIAVGCADQAVRIIDAKSGRIIGTLKGHSMPIQSIVFVNEMSLITASRDKTVRSWDLTSGKQTEVLYKDSAEIRTMACSERLKLLVIGTKDGRVILRSTK